MLYLTINHTVQPSDIGNFSYNPPKRYTTQSSEDYCSFLFDVDWTDIFFVLSNNCWWSQIQAMPICIWYLESSSMKRVHFKYRLHILNIQLTANDPVILLPFSRGPEPASREPSVSSDQKTNKFSSSFFRKFQLFYFIDSMFVPFWLHSFA